MFNKRVAGALASLERRIPDLIGRRRWPALASDVTTEEGMRRAILDLASRSRVQSRETGNIEDSFVTVADLIAIGVISPSGALLETRVAALEENGPGTVKP